MYYEEKIINGILHFRLMPEGRWKEMDKQSLTKMIVGYIAMMKDIKEVLNVNN